MAYDRLTAQDAAFLHLETPDAPMHVGSVGIFEGEPFLDESGRFRIDDVRDAIAARLHLAPKLRKRLQLVPLGQGRPIWVDDEALDLTYHVRHTALPKPGDEEQLLALVGRLQAQLLDRRRPLWEAWFVEGLEGGRVAIVLKTHHAMVDGIAGVDVATVLLDAVADAAPPVSEPWEPARAPNGVKLLVDTLVERVTRPAEAVRTLRAVLRGPSRALHQVIGAVRTVEELGRVVPRLPFNVPVGPHRRFEMVRIPLDDARRVRTPVGATVNDVVLAVTAGGLRHYLQERGEHLESLDLRVMVPVSVRGDDEHAALGNRVSSVLALLPIAEADPMARLRLVQQEMAHLKGSDEVLGVEALLALTGWFPPQLLGLAARLAPHQRFINLVVTNVPGPQQPLYCMGARLIEAFPYVGVMDNLALAVAVLSYDGQLGFGLSADRDAVPDLHVLAEGIEKSMAELLACVR